MTEIIKLKRTTNSYLRPYHRQIAKLALALALTSPGVCIVCALCVCVCVLVHLVAFRFVMPAKHLIQFALKSERLFSKEFLFDITFSFGSGFGALAHSTANLSVNRN